jgi:hypothetical protein
MAYGSFGNDIDYLALQSRNLAITNSEGYILRYWKELSTQQLLSLFMKNITLKYKSRYFLANVENKQNYKCCKLEIYKLTPSFRNSRLSSSEMLCWVVWSITRSFTLIYPYPGFFSFWNTYFVINEEQSQISYIIMYGISHHQNDTQTHFLEDPLMHFLDLDFDHFCGRNF